MQFCLCNKIIISYAQIHVINTVDPGGPNGVNRVLEVVDAVYYSLH